MPISAPQKPPKPPPPFKAPGENLARSARVATSGDYRASEMPPGHVNDGKADTSSNAGRWLSDARLPNWVELAWDEAKTVASARIVSGYLSGGEVADPIADLTLQRHDGKEWQDIPGAQAKGNSNPYLHLEFAPVKASRVRLHVTATQGKLSRIWEIELYGPAPKP